MQDQQIIATQRLALLGTLTGALAHEYSNLMTPVMAYAQEALRTEDARLMKRALEAGLPQMRRAVEISRKLLELAHDSSVGVAPALLSDLVNAAILCTLRRIERDNIRLDVDVPPQLEVMADPLLIQQLLLNLLLNAHQALRAASSPATGAKPGRIRVSARPDGPLVVIDVTDDGVGLAPDDIRNRINPFLAANARDNPQAFHSVGLGLHVCRWIAHAHGATIEALPNNGPGCTFRLRWPAPMPTVAAATMG